MQATTASSLTTILANHVFLGLLSAHRGLSNFLVPGKVNFNVTAYIVFFQLCGKSLGNKSLWFK